MWTTEEDQGLKFPLSMCTPTGLSWIYQRTGSDEFAESLRAQTSIWNRHLKIDPIGVLTRSEEPEAETAWEYCHAYFEKSLDSFFSVIHRTEFESRLRDHLHGEQDSPEDSAWYAIRNTVYATGCRIFLLTEHNWDFGEAQKVASTYFQNALTVHVQLLFAPPTLQSIQALLAMTLFAEGFGSPALGFMLAANTARLAQLKGLHHCSLSNVNIPRSESLQRNWLFWAIYIIEKQIALRAGRPSVIEDGDISCEILNMTYPGSTIDIEAFTSLIRHAQIVSQISSRLMTQNALKQTPLYFLETVQDLDKQLRTWRDSVPTGIRPPDRFIALKIPISGRPFATILAHYGYYGSLMAVHSIFSRPWITFRPDANVEPDEPSKYAEQTFASSNVVADAARNGILITRYLKVNGSCNQGFMLYCPMTSLIHLFIQVLNQPTLPSALPDIALLEVASSHFSHIEFATSSAFSFPFSRSVVTLARAAVTNAQSMHSSDDRYRRRLDHGASIATADKVGIACFEDFNLDNWGIFSSVLVDYPRQFCDVDIEPGKDARHD